MHVDQSDLIPTIVGGHANKKTGELKLKASGRAVTTLIVAHKKNAIGVANRALKKSSLRVTGRLKKSMMKNIKK